jgi:hypothetical protein
MNFIILGIAFAIAGFLLGFGDGGRGKQSHTISTFAGFVWLGGLVYAFLSGGIKLALISLLASFVISAATMPIGKAVIGGVRDKS